MGETRVDLLHLLEDLADAYPGALEETILTEIVANSLDSGSTRIEVMTDPAAATLTVRDDGHGMRRADLRRFHDIATSSKERGEGIGFAGVGIKLGLLVSDEVLTETRRGKDTSRLPGRSPAASVLRGSGWNRRDSSWTGARPCACGSRTRSRHCSIRHWSNAPCAATSSRSSMRVSTTSCRRITPVAFASRSMAW
jgi:hypothetical protein